MGSLVEKFFSQLVDRDLWRYASRHRKFELWISWCNDDCIVVSFSDYWFPSSCVFDCLELWSCGWAGRIFKLKTFFYWEMQMERKKMIKLYDERWWQNTSMSLVQNIEWESFISPSPNKSFDEKNKALFLKMSIKAKFTETRICILPFFSTDQNAFITTYWDPSSLSSTLNSLPVKFLSVWWFMVTIQIFGSRSALTRILFCFSCFQPLQSFFSKKKLFFSLRRCTLVYSHFRRLVVCRKTFQPNERVRVC